jgi:hypothetical protein
MKILFGALHFGCFRNFESVIVDLASRGHTIHLWADEPERLGGQALVERLASEHASVTWGFSPGPVDEPAFALSRKLRQGLDYLRFLDPRYDAFPKLRSRAAERIPRALGWLVDLPGMTTERGRRALTSALAGIDGLMPRNPAVDAYMRAETPDLVLLASVTNPRSPQLDHLRSARALGIPVAVCVYSWDHLSSKTLIRVVPDRVLLWNETQRREAIELHGIPEDRIVVTGAQCYDQWFAREPSLDRPAFAARVGLRPDRPIVLYVCSALTPDPGEARFVRSWIEALRTSDDALLHEAGILVRPHPERLRDWDAVDLEGMEQVRLWGRNPIDAGAKNDYFDALFHCSTVMGLVTSAFLEAAIVGRPVHTLLLPEFRPHQEGMLHFRYLLEVEGGLLRASRDFGEHLNGLAASLRERPGHDLQNRRFVQAFVRPAGLDRPATPIFVEAVERLGALGRREAESSSPWPERLAPFVRRLAIAAEHGRAKSLFVERRLAEEWRVRDEEVARNRREHRRRWREHRRRKLVARVQWKMKRLREIVQTGSLTRQDG